MSWQAKVISGIAKLTVKRKLGKAGSVEKERAALSRVSKALARVPKGDTAEVGGVPGEWLLPPGADDSRVILYLHGGAYVLGSPDSHRDMVFDIAKAAGARAFIADYRLAPEHPFPAAVEDGVAAYRGIMASGIAPNKIIICGDSAGGGLTLATLLSLRDSGDPSPAGGVCLSAWADLTSSSPSRVTKAAADSLLTPQALSYFGALYLNGQKAEDPLASPVYGDCTGLPPLLIHVGSEEILLDDSIRFAEKAKAAGVDVILEEWPGMMHVWHLMARFIPEGKRAIAGIGEFVRARTADASRIGAVNR